MVSEGIQENDANVNDKCIRLTAVLENSISQLVEEKIINTNCSAKQYTIQLAQQKRKRDKNYNKFLQTNQNSDWTIYKTARNLYSRALITTRRSYFVHKINQNRKNSKELWKVFKSLLNTRETFNSPSIIFNGSTVYDSQKIAETFNKFFVPSVLDIRHSIGQTNEAYSLRETDNIYKFRSIS